MVKQRVLNNGMARIINRVRGILLLIGLALASGCTHALVVKNLDSYQVLAANTLSKPQTIRIIPQGQAEQELINGIGEQLRKAKAKVIMSYAGSAKIIDVVAKVHVKSNFEGSNWNFLINFPGYLIFTPAWHGYEYKVTHTVHVQLCRGLDDEHIDEFTIPVVLDVRHADADRTWTELSWFEIGAIAFVGGIVFIDYDDDVTPLLADKIGRPVGSYLAQEIVNRINQYEESSKVVQAPGAARPINAAASLAERLRELKKLNDDGTISDEEYKRKRQEIIKGL